MNKHMIFLPALLTSAVSLHVLSFYIEEPVEIVQDSNIKVSSNIDTKINTTDNKQSEKMVTIPVEKGNNVPSGKAVVANKDGKKEVNEVVSGKQNTVAPSASANTGSVPSEASNVASGKQ